MGTTRLTSWCTPPRSLVVALVASLAVLPPAAHADPVAATVAITDVRIVDVARGRLTAPRTILIDGERIVAVTSPRRATVPPGARRIDGRGRFVMPGLVDAHVHLFNTVSRRAPNDWALPLFIANGVTAVREMAAEPGSLATIAAWRDEARRGARVMPRLVATCVKVDAPTVDAVVRRVDAAVDAGADCLKVFSEIAPDHWRAALAAAKRRGVPLVGHVPARIRARDAWAAGQGDAEHLMQLFEACASNEDDVMAAREALAGDALAQRRDEQDASILAAYDDRRCAAVARAVARSGQVQVPTLVLPMIEASPTRAGIADDPRFHLLRDDEQARWRRIIAATPVTLLAVDRWRVARAITGRLHAAGAIILAGTDAPMPAVFPGFSLHEELDALVASGLSPADALRAATIAPARAWGLDGEIGAVAPGRRADLVLLDADPLTAIGHARRIRAVVLGGTVLDRAALDALLAPAVKSSTR